MYGVFGVLFAFILLALGLIQMFTYRATPEAQETWNIAAFEQKNNWTHFEVTGEKKGTLLFYTGALVEPQAYAKLADGLAKEGIEVYIISSQLNLPVLDNGTMATIVKEEHLDKVFVGGHSLGGVVSTIEAKKLKYIASTLKGKFAVYSGTADLSIYFNELGLNLLAEKGIISYITTNKFFNTGYGEKVRSQLSSQHYLLPQ